MSLAASDLAKRAQPQTVASRLNLRDLQDVITHMAAAAHALGNGIEDRWSASLPPNLRSVTNQAGAVVLFAAGHLDSAVQAMAQDLHALHRQDRQSPHLVQSPGKRWLVRAADLFAAGCEELRAGRDPLDARPELLRSICSYFGSAVNHVALLTDNACEHALGRTSAALTPLVEARRELERARQRADVLRASLES